MILTRKGNKRAIAKDIYKLFASHKTYIEPFFGAGGMFFSKPKAKYNILNDLDNEVYNLFIQWQQNKEALYELIKIAPIHQEALKSFKPKGNLERAWLFLFKASFSLMSTGQTLRLQSTNTKTLLLNNINTLFYYIQDVVFSNKKAVEFLKSITYSTTTNPFIYCDPPYINTNNNYNTPKWGEESFEKLIKTLLSLDKPFAISEFDNDFVVNEARKNNLVINDIGERHNIGNKRNEILITNYNPNRQKSIFN